MNIKNLIIPLVALAASTIVAACGDAHGDTVYFDDIRTPDFDSVSTTVVKSGDTLNVDCIGIHGIAVRNGLLFASTMEEKGALKVFDAATLSPLGAFLNVGSGPGEFAAIPEMEQYSIITDGNVTTACVPDFPRGVLHELALVHIADTLQVNDKEIDLPQLRDFCTSAKDLGDSRFLIQNVNPEDWSISYSYFDNGTSRPDPALETLNSAKVDDGIYIGAILSYPLISRSRKAVAVVNGLIRQINVFSLDGSFAPFTIAPDGKLDSYRHLIDTQWPVEENYYSSGCGSDDFFAVCRQDKDNATSQLFIYGWDGNVKNIYQIPALFSSFDIDAASGSLYTFNLQDEAIIRYSLSDFKRILSI